MFDIDVHHYIEHPIILFLLGLILFGAIFKSPNESIFAGIIKGILLIGLISFIVYLIANSGTP